MARTSTAMHKQAMLRGNVAKKPAAPKAAPTTIPHGSTRGHRPTDLPEAGPRILEALRNGNFRSTAAALAGVRAATWHDWMRRGARGEEPFAKFAEQCRQAEAAAEEEMVGAVRSADDWKAAAWHLERRAGRRWTKREAAEAKPREAMSPDDMRAALVEYVRQHPEALDALLKDRSK